MSKSFENKCKYKNDFYSVSDTGDSEKKYEFSEPESNIWPSGF